MKVNLFTKTGGKSEKTITLPKAIFESEVNETLINKAIRVYLANQRQSNAHSKTRGDVRGGGKKPWRQKGTGRARSGSIRNPIFTGGGVAFGPSNKANHKLAMNKKEKQVAIRSAFTIHAKGNTLAVFEGFDLGKEKHTQTLEKVVSKTKLEGKVLIVQSTPDSELIRAASNLRNIDTEVVNSISAYQLLKYKNIIVTPETVDKISEFWGGNERVETKTTKKEDSKKTKVTKE